MLRTIVCMLTLPLTFLFAEINENFSLNSNRNDAISIEFNLDEIELIQTNGFTKIKSSTMGETSIIGFPKLPEYSTMVLLQPDREYEISYTVLESSTIENIDIIPNQPIENGLEKLTIDEMDEDLYYSKRAYPFENVIMTDPMVMRDVVVSNISIVPFSFKPQSRELEVYHSLELTITDIGPKEDIRRREMPKSKVFEDIYKNTIINYETNTSRDAYQQPAILYICSSNLENNQIFQQLVEWRRQRGYVVYTASTSETGSSTTSIKNYIENAYDNFNPPPEYVALLGDVGGTYSIPTYYEDYGHDSYGSDCEGDHLYSLLDGPDLLSEVLMGRMSIRSSSELSTVIYKILYYEQATYLDSYPDYYKNASMAGDPSTSGNSCAITKESIKELLDEHGFNDVDIKTSGNGWSSWMQNELSDGTLYFNYRGYLGMSGFSSSNVDNASSGWKLPFATILTCGTGSFAEDQTSMTEKFFRAGSVTNPKGGVGAIGTATWNTHTLFNNIVDLGIYDGIFADRVGTAGASLASGKLALYNTYPGNPYNWISAFTLWNNLIGDPATHLWTDTPQEFMVSHPTELHFGTNYLEVTVQDENGNPVENALVSMLKEHSVIAENGSTDAMGIALFGLDNDETNDITITVTKPDFKPYQYTLSIVQENLNVNLDSNQNIIINDGNDGIAQSGEYIELSIPLINLGIETVNGISATLSGNSDFVNIENTTVNYGSLAANTSSFGQNEFSLTISPMAEQYDNLDLVLSIEDDSGNTWSSLVPVDVSGILLSAVSFGYFEPGQNANVDITLQNSGLMDAVGVTGTLGFNGSQIEINDSNGAWGDIESGSSSNSINGFNVTFSESIVYGSQFTLILTLQTADGFSKTIPYNITVGHVRETDPLGPDQYGYYIYDSGDVDYELAPEYNWEDISSIGTNLNLSNSGNGNWSGNGPIAHVDLPFTFTFYGVDYNEISVCTNGWVSPGYSSAESFRNYPIPGAGGPTPMIAAFWDDLETGSNGEVYVYSTNQYVIVQWDGLRTNWSNDSNTFQMILYNDNAQPNGDNNIKIQYQDFNNTSSGSFSSYPPIHGSYATIGLENQLSNDGLQYSYYDEYPIPAMELGDGTALYITTQPPVALPSPQLNYQVGDTEFEIAIDESESSSLIIENTGEEGSILYYDVSTSYPDLESPFEISGGGPDAFGYFWSDNTISNELSYNWFDLPNDAIQLSFIGNDASTSLLDIGFDFSFYGDVYSQFLVNANGWVGFGEDNNEWYNSNIPSSEYPRPAIFGFWDDLNPVNDNCSETCAGNVYYHGNSDRLVIWFDSVVHWTYASSYSFQIVIYPNGEIEINHANIEGEFSATVGIQNATGTIASQVDVYNGSYFDSEISYKFERQFVPTNWLSIESISGDGFSGELLFGESAEFGIIIDATDLIEGEYDSSVLVSSNQDSVEIPFALTVTSDSLVLGDLNGDTTIDVIDIVLLVSVILDGTAFNPAGDINQDGVNNVLDVVQLVDIILEG